MRLAYLGRRFCNATRYSLKKGKFKTVGVERQWKMNSIQTGRTRDSGIAGIGLLVEFFDKT